MVIDDVVLTVCVFSIRNPEKLKDRYKRHVPDFQLARRVIAELGTEAFF